MRVAAGHILAAVEQMEESRPPARRRRRRSPATTSSSSSRRSSPRWSCATRKGDFKRAWERLDELHRIVKTKSNDQERHRVALNLAQARAALGDRADRAREPAGGRAAPARRRGRDGRAHARARPRRSLHARLPVGRPALREGDRDGARARPHLRGDGQPAQPRRAASSTSTTCRAPTARSSSRSRSARRAATSGSRTTTACSSRSSTACRARPTAPKLLGQGDRLRREQGLHVGRHRRARAPREAPAPARRRRTRRAMAYEKRPRARGRAPDTSLIADDCDQALMALQASPARSASAS